MTSSRFDYVAYDLAHLEMQNEAKQLCLDLESFIDQMVPSRAKSLALTALEESYMWIGKAVRDSQVEAEGRSIDNPQRGESDYPRPGKESTQAGMPVILTGD